MASPLARKQLAIRRLLLDGKGGLNADAKVLVVDMRRFCHADHTTICFSPQTGSIDPVASIAAASRREVWDHLAKLLGLDAISLMNITDTGL